MINNFCEEKTEEVLRQITTAVELGRVRHSRFQGENMFLLYNPKVATPDHKQIGFGVHFNLINTGFVQIGNVPLKLTRKQSRQIIALCKRAEIRYKEREILTKLTNVKTAVLFLTAIRFWKR